MIRTLQDERCLLCEGVFNPHKAIIAFSAANEGGAVVVRGTKHLLCDLREFGADAGDMWHGPSVPTRGIWVWEGRIVVTVTPSSPNGPEESDTEYVGTWRELTSQEWAELME